MRCFLKWGFSFSSLIGWIRLSSEADLSVVSFTNLKRCRLSFPCCHRRRGRLVYAQTKWGASIFIYLFHQCQKFKQVELWFWLKLRLDEFYTSFGIEHDSSLWRNVLQASLMVPSIQWDWSRFFLSNGPLYLVLCYCSRHPTRRHNQL